MHSAEMAIAKAQAAADEKREVEREVAEIKKYKDFRERNEEERDLIIRAAKACMFDPKTNELLPAGKQDRANFARCMTVAAQLTAQIKPTAPAEGEKGGPQESGFMKCYMAQADELYATESQKDRKTGIRLEASQPKAKADPVLVDSKQSR